MNTRLSHLVNTAETHRQSLLAELAHYPPEVLQRPPAPGAWSVVEVLQHLILAETATLAYMKKKLMGVAHVPKTGGSAEFRMLLLRIFNALPLKIKAPAVIANPPAQVSLEETARQWHALRQQWRAFLESIPENDLRKALFKHPLAGRLNVYHAADFMDWHVIRHEKQIRKALKNNALTV